MNSTKRIFAIFALVPLVWGCASGRTASLGECALMGAAAGGAGGAVIGQTVINDNDAAAVAGGAGVGLVTGAALGYLVCMLIPEAEEPKAPPPPAPPAPPRAAPPPPPPPPAAEKLVLRGVNFAFNSAEVDEPSKLVLQVAAEQLNKRPDVRVRVEGHTDNVGPEGYNQGLSERRANAVRQILVDNGVSPGRLTSEGFGMRNPIASNDTREGRALNRRVELVPQ